MKIGIIGSGSIGQAFAKQVTKAGYDLILSNSRGPESIRSLVKNLGGGATAGTVQEAASSEIVFLAVPWNRLHEVTTSVSSWKGKVVIDPTNPIIMPGFQIADLGGKTSSEIVSDLVPGANLVKAFNTLTPGVLGSDPHDAGGKRVIFFSGDDTASKNTVATLIRKMGFAGIDLGKLSEGGKLQQFPGGPLPTLNLIQLG